MQPPVEGSCANKTIGKLFELASGDKQLGSFLINLWKMAFEEAFQLICPVRAGAMSVVACQLLQLMEQCVARLGVAMFNAILWESMNKIPTDSISNPIRKAYTSDEELNSPLTSTIEKLLLSPTIVAKGSMNGEHKLDGYGGLIELYKLLCEFFPTSRATKLRREIVEIRQKEMVFTTIGSDLRSCVQVAHNMMPLVGGVGQHDSPTSKDLISMMAVNIQQFRANPKPTRRVHQLSNSTLEDKVDGLTNILNSLVIEKTRPTRLCGICATPKHTTDACPSLYDDTITHLNAMRNFLGPPQKRYDLYANTYNPGWKDHSNLSYGANPLYNQPHQNWFPQ
ncbi:hypothetical protein Godav_005324 [Gossypium davidsonii]|uniref:Uncharacterized protein n=1 Tax=Gossypium davidsonii TaxID=34287 RepID=A0A7J8TI49_GOSDV|nr:hypothetical protein [Gossypium davidsonii]